MSTIRRPARRRKSALSRRQALLNHNHQRPLFGAERLEPRAMLAGDLSSLAASEYCNLRLPTDVNNDGVVTTLDLLPLINDLTLTGPRSLVSATTPSAAASEGEAAAENHFYIDPNNDGNLNALDLLSVVNDLSGEGEAEGEDPTLVNFTLVPVIHGTNTPITQIQEGFHYELRVLIEDKGVLSFNNDTRNALQGNGESALGAFTAFLDMFWDRAQTDVQVNETQTLVLNGTPTANTRFRITFTDTDGTQETTAPIVFAGANRDQTAANIRTALLALTKLNLSNGGALPDIEVAPGNNSRTFQIRFINGEANKDFANLVGFYSTPAGGTDITVTETVKGDPNLLASFQEMFRPRAVRDANFDIINDDVNDLLYYGNYVGLGDKPVALPGPNGVSRAGGNAGPVLSDFSGPRPGTQIVEVFRLRMTAKEKIGNQPVTFSGAYPQLSNLFVTLLGDASPNSGAFSQAIPAGHVTFTSGTLNITEPISATDDAVSLNEGITGGNLNRVVIDVLANDTDGISPNNLVLLAPTLPPGFQGTVQLRTAGQDGVNRPHFLYIVPNADFNGVQSFQYTIRDGVNPPLLTDTATVTVTVNATNDAPVNSVPLATQTVAEDSLAGLVFGGGNSISISDIDAGAGNVSVNLVSTNGVLTMASLPGTLTITGDGTNNLTIVGAIADINPALSGLKYTPNANFNGPATITVLTSDNGNSGSGGALSDTDVININVTAVNDGPVNTAPALVQVDENATLAFTGGNTISVADLDVGAATISVNLTTNSAFGGLLSVTAAGATVSGNNSQNLTVTGTLAAVNNTLASLQFTAGLPESVTLTITTSDQGNTGTGGALTDVDTVTINVLATVRPRATPDIVNLLEGPATFDVSVLGNDLPNAGAQVTLASLGSVSVGSIARNENGTPADLTDDTIIYTPPFADFFGQVTFTYTIGETPVTGATVIGPNATAQVTLNIGNVADAPVATGDGPYAATEDVARTVNAANGVLANDVDADNLSPTLPNAGLTAVLVPASAVGGSVNLAADGSFVFTPTLNFNGNASFRYQARDPQGNLSNEATVTINFAAVNDAPVANNDGPGGVFVTNEDTVLNVLVANSVLGNDTDIDSPLGNLTAVLVPGSAIGGTVNLAADGSFEFTPNLDFNGTASFRYQVNDNDPTTPQLSNEATVSITVLAVNDVPVAGTAEFTVEEGQILTVPVGLGLRNFVTDADQPGGFTGSIALGGTSPAQGTLNLAANGSFTYTPPPTIVSDFDVTFTFTASDGQSTSTEGTVTIHVTQFNDPPVAVNDGPFSTTEDNALTIPRADILGNDSDEETANASLAAVIVNNVPAAAGNVVINGDGSFTYTPAANFFTTPGNPISFTYQVRDQGLKLSNVATVTINVQEDNDDPIANDDTFQPAIKNQLNQPVVPNPLANDSAGPDAGVAGEVLSIDSVSGTSSQGGTVTLVSGQIRYTPPTDFTGADSFQYTISDGRGGTATGTVNVNVVDFIPKTIRGTVFIDADNDGILDAGEKRLAGAEVRLNGTNVLGSPNFAQLVVFTDARGNYSFSNLAPGNYTLTEVQPKFLLDGKDKLAGANALVTAATNNRFVMSWNVPQSISTGAINGLNFGERGINASQLTNTAGLKGEMLASSGAKGMVLAVNRAGHRFWSYNHLGWNTTADLQLEFSPNGTILSALLTVNGVTKRIFQSPSRNTGTGSPQTPPAGSPARFRVIGNNNNGEYIIRLDGSMADFGFVAAAAPAPQAGEGESAPQMSDDQYRHAADEVFANKAWA